MPDAAPPAHPARPPGWWSPLAGTLGLAVVLALGTLALRQPLPPGAPPRASGDPAPAGPAAATGRPCGPAGEGYVRGPVFGALALDTDWHGPTLLCDGSVRPGGQGVRLFFAQPLDQARIVLMIGIDAPPEGLAGGERPANVTLIDERSGRFFSSGGTGRCWVDELRTSPESGTPGGQWLAGRLYCAGALPSLADRASLTLGDIRFSGRFGPGDD